MAGPVQFDHHDSLEMTIIVDNKAIIFYIGRSFATVLNSYLFVRLRWKGPSSLNLSMYTKRKAFTQ